MNALAPILTRARSRPDLASGALQILKNVVATVTAWWIATTFLESALPFLAPWVALLTVQTTVYRTVRSGIETFITSIAGVFLAFAVAVPLGVNVLSLSIALSIGLATAALPVFRREGVNVAATALMIMAGNDQYDLLLLGDRVIEVGLGVVVALLVNALVMPPLRNGGAARQVHEVRRRLGELLVGMADEFRTSWTTDRSQTWVRRTEEMDDILRDAWEQVGLARESTRWNTRARSPRVDPGGPAHTLRRLHEGVSHLRNVVRTIDEASMAEGDWDTDFRMRWTDIALECGRRLCDPDAEPTEPVEALDRLAARMSHSALPALHWPVYGALITGLRHMARIVDEVSGTPGTANRPG